MQPKPNEDLTEAIDGIRGVSATPDYPSLSPKAENRLPKANHTTRSTMPPRTVYRAVDQNNNIIGKDLPSSPTRKKSPSKLGKGSPSKVTRNTMAEPTLADPPEVRPA